MEVKKEQINDFVISGSISRTIFKLALPVVLGMLMEFALSSTDYFWVGKLGPSAQDAVTSSMVIIWTIFVMISVFSIGMSALISRNVGAKNLEKAKFYIKQGITLAIGLAILLSVAGYFMTPLLLRFMGTSQNTIMMAVPYLRIFFLSTTFFYWNEAIYTAFRASGDTKTPTFVGIIIVIVNMILDPFLIFGYGPFPELGVKGASIASFIAVLFGLIIITVFTVRGKIGYQIGKLATIKPDFKELYKIIKIGLPMATQQMVFVIVYWFLIKIVHEYGETAAAAMGIGNRMESFSYLICFGFSVAASTMVGQNLGAKQPQRAAKCAWGTIGIASAITFVISILFIVFPKFIASIFTSNPQVLSIAIDYLIILGISQMAMATEIVLEGAFSGAGDTIPPMIVMLPGSLARIPLAYYLCFTLDWGINGVWWTLTITTFAKAIVLALWFKRGKWKEKII
jgi:putative MATE family efflux protein